MARVLPGGIEWLQIPGELDAATGPEPTGALQELYNWAAFTSDVVSQLLGP